MPVARLNPEPPNAPGWVGASLEEPEFQRIAHFVWTRAGIKLRHEKIVMVESRLRRRLRALDLASYEAYCDFALESSAGQLEVVELLNAITTNKTDFYRESAHFDQLVQLAIPALQSSRNAGLQRPLKLWSAACSTGEEPYSLAIVLSEFARTTVGFDFRILATDLSTTALATAKKGVYPEDRIAPVPVELRHRYLQRSTRRSCDLIKIGSALRAKVRFEHFNLKERALAISGPVDVVFCRNVLIYFDEDMQRRVIEMLSRHLGTGGFLFLGHSEGIQDLTGLPLRARAPTVYEVRR